MGSYLRGMSKQEWTKAIKRLGASLDTNIQSILKLSYDALEDQDKDLFLHIACFFHGKEVEKVEAYLEDSFVDVRHGIDVLTEKSLISIDEWGYIRMHNLLAQLGKDIVRKQHIREPAQRLFLTKSRDVFKVLKDDASGNESVIGIIEEKLHINERAIEGLYNLQFIIFTGDFGSIYHILQLPRDLKTLDYIPRNLRLLEWWHFPMTCLPSIFKTDFLVTLKMPRSEFEKLWEGNKPLGNLKWMDLALCRKLTELPDLTTATSLQKLDLSNCSSLIKLSSTIGNATNLKELNLSSCSSLISLPSSIGNAINLQKLNLSGCSSLISLPSTIGNAINLRVLNLRACSSLISLPSPIGNTINLKELNLSGCLCLVDLPSSIGNASSLEELNLSYCSSLIEIPLSIGNLHKLQSLVLRDCSKLKVLPTNINLESLHTLDLTDCLLIERFPEISTNISVLMLEGTAIKKIPSSIKSWSRLNELYLKRCRKLVSVPQIPSSISFIDTSKCESLDRLFQNSYRNLRFDKCFNLSQEAKDFIIQAPSSFTVLPGIEIPAYFTHRASGGSLTIKLNEMLLPTSMIVKACVLLIYKGDDEDYDEEIFCVVSCKSTREIIHGPLSGHMYTFNVEADVTSNEVVFDFKMECPETVSSSWKVGECGVVCDTIKQAKKVI